jgi:hypothetical protein
MVEEIDYSVQPNSSGIGMYDLEERQRILKDRILLIGKNLIEFKDKTNQNLLELKKEMEIIKSDGKRMNDFLETLSQEISKFARKEDLTILSKQAKMFQPLEFVTKSELNKKIKEITG